MVLLNRKMTTKKASLIIEIHIVFDVFTIKVGVEGGAAY